jgi:hypothetical protein
VEPSFVSRAAPSLPVSCLTHLRLRRECSNIRREEVADWSSYPASPILGLITGPLPARDLAFSCRQRPYLLPRQPFAKRILAKNGLVHFNGFEIAEVEVRPSVVIPCLPPARSLKSNLTTTRVRHVGLLC